MDSFELDNQKFIMMNRGEAGTQIYEKIGNGKVFFIKHWAKEKKHSSANEITNFTFSDPIEYLYLKKETGIFRIKRRKELLLQVKEEFRPDIRKKLRKLHLRIKRTDNTALETLLEQMKGQMM